MSSGSTFIFSLLHFQLSTANPDFVTWDSVLPNDRWVSLMVQQVKNLPKVPETQEMWVWSLGQEDPLEEEMTTHYSILAWKIPWAEEPGGLQSKELLRIRRDWVTRHIDDTRYNIFFLFLKIGNYPRAIVLNRDCKCLQNQTLKISQRFLDAIMSGECYWYVENWSKHLNFPSLLLESHKTKTCCTKSVNSIPAEMP